MVPPWGKGSSSRGRTHDRNVLSGGSGGCRSRGGGSRAWVGAAGRGRRRPPHSGLKVVSFALLHHGWAGEGEEMERMGGREVSEMILE